MAFPPDIMDQFSALRGIIVPRVLQVLARLLIIGTVILTAFFIFAPWVQTAYGTGTVTSLSPDDRPQSINALVSGRIKHWHVREGSLVKAGDPLLEIVDNDVDYILRLEEKRDALQRKLNAARIGAETAQLDVDRQQDLHAQGLSAKRTYEQAKIKLNAQLAAVSQVESELNRAQVMLAQQNMQTVRAPRDGMIIEIMAGDSATTLSSGDTVAKFIPANVVPAIELFIDGNDIPLIQTGRKVRLQFEGWPVVQFSGWPARAIGTFGGIVNSIDPTVSANGRFRIIVVADPEDETWPGDQFLRMGAKVKGWVLLETVSIGFELWRNLNNFPPEFSKPKNVIAEE